MRLVTVTSGVKKCALNFDWAQFVFVGGFTALSPPKKIDGCKLHIISEASVNFRRLQIIIRGFIAP
jgi:hypothetical protein